MKEPWSPQGSCENGNILFSRSKFLVELQKKHFWGPSFFCFAGDYLDEIVDEDSL